MLCRPDGRQSVEIRQSLAGLPDFGIMAFPLESSPRGSNPCFGEDQLLAFLSFGRTIFSRIARRVAGTMPEPLKM